MEQVIDKRQAILDTTLRLISQNGFHGTSMSQVAKEAKVSAGIIYHYFVSKDELINELYKSIKEKIVQAIMQDFDTEQPLKSQIQQVLRSAIRYAVWHPQESAFVEQYIRSPYQRTEVDTQVYQPITACFEQAKQEQIIKDLPQGVINIFSIDIATALAQKQAHGQIVLTDKLVNQVIETSWEAIRQ